MTMEGLQLSWNKLYRVEEGWQLYDTTVPSAERQLRTAFREPGSKAAMDVQEPSSKPCLSWALDTVGYWISKVNMARIYS